MKPLVDLLLWFLLLQLGVLVVLRYRYWDKAPYAWKTAWRLMVLLLFGLGVVSISLVSRGLERSLLVTASGQDMNPPAYIFVLGGGFIPGTSPDQDVLVVESSRRVLTAVALWREHPEATLVFSGASGGIKNRSPDRLVQLMAETAGFHGVPKDHMLPEARSRNTREHPIEALKLPGITPRTPIGLVTSAWHMRRARREFCRYFAAVQIHSVTLPSYSSGWQDFMPNSDALGSSTVFLREWVGLAWYAALGAGGYRENEGKNLCPK